MKVILWLLIHVKCTQKKYWKRVMILVILKMIINYIQTYWRHNYDCNINKYHKTDYEIKIKNLFKKKLIIMQYIIAMYK